MSQLWCVVLCADDGMMMSHLSYNQLIPVPPPEVRSPSPAHQDNKWVSPTRTAEQKPFRGFDITSLIRKDDEDEPLKRERSPPTSPANSSTSPKVSVGPPVEKSSNPYAGLFGSNLYQQYLGQILSSQAGGHSFPGAPAAFPPMLNPMLQLQAQLAMAAQSQAAGGAPNYPGAVAASMLAERLKAQRYSPYSRQSPSLPTSSLNTSMSSSMHSPTGPSAFRSLTPKSNPPSSPPASPPHSASPPASLDLSPKQEQPSPPKNDIRNIENMINGLNGSKEGRYSLSHDARKFV